MKKNQTINPFLMKKKEEKSKMYGFCIDFYGFLWISLDTCIYLYGFV